MAYRRVGAGRARSTRAMAARRQALRRPFVAGVLVALCGCSDPPPAPSAVEAVTSPAVAPTAASSARKTTDGSIALGNLDAQIAGTERLAKTRALSVRERVAQAELLTQRGQILGRVSDYEAAGAIADALVTEAPTDPDARLARARARATFHRFGDALADCDEAERLGAHANAVDAVRAGIFQATGKEREAFDIRHRLSEARPDILTLGAEATLRAARGELDEAERLFEAALASYRDVSPFPVAWLEFQRGLVWMREDDLPRARGFLAAAHARLPQHAQARGHLAEVEAALGAVPRAVDLLRPLAETAEDPDYAAQLARILGEAGRADDAKPWRERAIARYDVLMTTHPEAFADHAAELWLAAGADPKRALGYAERNLTLRPTVRAWELVLRAAQAVGDGERACAAANGAREAGYLYASARTVVDAALTHCPGCAD